jgi:hypothetical protein
MEGLSGVGSLKRPLGIESVADHTLDLRTDQQSPQLVDNR